MALISYLTTVRLDAGARRFLAEDLKAAGISRPLMVTDRGVRAVGLLDLVLKDGGIDVGIPIFDEFPQIRLKRQPNRRSRFTERRNVTGSSLWVAARRWTSPKR